MVALVSRTEPDPAPIELIALSLDLDKRGSGSALSKLLVCLLSDYQQPGPNWDLRRRTKLQVSGSYLFLTHAKWVVAHQILFQNLCI